MSPTARTFFLLITFTLTAAIPADDDAPATTRPASPFSPIPTPHLHNAHRVTDKVLSGAQPEGDDSFETLASLGVKTIISVDGAKPDVAAAKKHGLRYVHLPIGYDAVEPDEALALAKAIADLPGPIYVHCHHGKHRSAAAVAVACVTNGSLPPERAVSVLQTFGTGQNYLGLWRSARDAKPLDPALLEQVKVEYRETAPVPPLAEAMVSIERHFDHLRQLQKSSWNAIPHHPDLAADHEALQLHEHLSELSRGGNAKGKTPEYLKLLEESRDATRSLREALAAAPLRDADARDAMTRLAKSCTTCHARFRD